MKRQNDREYSPRNKRNRGAYSPDIEYQERVSSESFRYEKKVYGTDGDLKTSSRRSTSPRGRRYEDSYYDNATRQPYRSLCISNFKHSIQESYIEEILTHEFEKYGEFNIKFSIYGGQKVAYVNFRYAEDARKARHGKPKLIIAERSCRVEPVYSSYAGGGGGSASSTVSSAGAVIPSAEDAFQQAMAAALGHGYGYSGIPSHSSSRYHSHHDVESLAAAHAAMAAAAEEYARAYPGIATQAAIHHLTSSYAAAAVAAAAGSGSSRGGSRGDGRYDSGSLRDHRSGGGYYEWSPDNSTYSGESASLSRTRSKEARTHGGLVPVERGSRSARDHLSEEPGGTSRMGYESSSRGTHHSRGTHRHSEDSHSSHARDKDHHPHHHRRSGSGRDSLSVSTDPNDAKFPHHMHHINPEDDESATRTLFLGNLFYDISEEDIRTNFERFGVIEDIDIKRPTKQGSGNAYAFIRFMNLDMAHAAKVEMSGSYIKNLQCKIGYGKVLPSRCLWIGGLGSSWCSVELLEAAFKCHGALERVEWPSGKNYAYILFESVDNAIAACNDMRGKSLGNSDKRLRIDYGEPEHIDADSQVEKTTNVVSSLSTTASLQRNALRRNSSCSGGATSALHSCAGATSMSDLVSGLNVLWSGSLVLKRTAFPVRLYLLRGESDLAESKLARLPTNEPLRISQRMKLDSSKLEEVASRISEAGTLGCSIMIALSEKKNSNSSSSVGNELQSRPLHHLVDYLQSKQAAGVIFLKDAVLHAFPQCDFAYQLLKRQARNLEPGYASDDHLVLLLIRLPSSMTATTALITNLNGGGGGGVDDSTTVSASLKSTSTAIQKNEN